jgi:hypothetical protein
LNDDPTLRNDQFAFHIRYPFSSGLIVYSLARARKSPTDSGP